MRSGDSVPVPERRTSTGARGLDQEATNEGLAPFAPDDGSVAPASREIDFSAHAAKNPLAAFAVAPVREAKPVYGLQRLVMPVRSVPARPRRALRALGLAGLAALALLTLGFLTSPDLVLSTPIAEPVARTAESN